MSTTHDDAIVHARDQDIGSESKAETIVAQTDSEPPEQLDLLADEYARELLTLLSSGPRQGRELTEATGFSRPTVYRRLNRLEDAGLVTSRIRLDPDGNHCKEFALVRARLRVSIEDGSLTVTATSTSTE